MPQNLYIPAHSLRIIFLILPAWAMHIDLCFFFFFFSVSIHHLFSLAITSHFPVWNRCLQALNPQLLLSVSKALTILCPSALPASHHIQPSLQVQFPLVNFRLYPRVTFLLPCFVTQGFAHVLQVVLPFFPLHSIHRVWEIYRGPVFLTQIFHTCNHQPPCIKKGLHVTRNRHEPEPWTHWPRSTW